MSIIGTIRADGTVRLTGDWHENGRCKVCGQPVDPTSITSHACPGWPNVGAVGITSDKLPPTTAELLDRLTQRVEALERRVAELEAP